MTCTYIHTYNTNPQIKPTLVCVYHTPPHPPNQTPLQTPQQQLHQVANSLRVVRGINAVMADAASLRLMVEAVRWSSLSAAAAAVAALATSQHQHQHQGQQGQGQSQPVQQPPGSISAPVSMHFEVDPDDIIMNGETVRCRVSCLLSCGCS